MFQEMDRILEQVSRDRRIPKDRLIEAIEAAFLSAARKKWGHLGELEAHYNRETNEIELFQFKTVVEIVQDAYREMTPTEAAPLDAEAQIGDSIGVKMDPKVFGRIAAQAAKQVIISKMRDAERDIVCEEFQDRVGEIVTGIVRRVERGDIVVDLGRTEAIIPRTEQIPGERSQPGERVQGYFMTLNREGRGPQVVLSRRHPQLVVKLFEMEVPEIAEDIVQIKTVAREAGVRTKIGVYSKDSDVDPVGACVGMKGSRVQNVVQELRGEKIDIVQWDEDPARFVCNAVAPAEVVKVIIREKDHSMEVVVPDDQLSLAIGRRGQNVRLAAQLTGWNIDVLSESKVEELASRHRKVLSRVLEVDDPTSLILYSHGYRTLEDILAAGEDEFIELPGMSTELLRGFFNKAKQTIESGLRTETLLAQVAAEEQAARAAEAAAAAAAAEAEAAAAAVPEQSEAMQ
ncbi:MAG: transcription termination/antitermination protein NusA [Deltaproteobacteria bacterium]|nr:transcription termination/antitermination protein NusA [Deltaproteobacteria bacterium]